MALSAAVTLFAQTPTHLRRRPSSYGRRVQGTCGRRPGTPGRPFAAPSKDSCPRPWNAPDIKVEVVKDFMKLPPNVYMGEGIGVATNSKGHIFVNTCAQQTRNFEFDQNGNYVREIGKDLYGNVFCHGIRVDAQDNIWVIDEGANIDHQVQPRRPRDNDPGPPDWVPLQRDGARREGGSIRLRPTFSIAPPTSRLTRPGNIFVADGYGNSRIVKYDKNGRFLKQVGSRGSGPGQFNLIHAIAVDAQGNVYGGSRSDQRIVVFDNDLNYKTTYDHVGAPWSLCITPGPHQYLYTSNSNPDSQDTRAAQGQRPDLQDGAGRHRPRQVRCPRQRAGTVQHGARNRLPR